MSWFTGRLVAVGGALALLWGCTVGAPTRSAEQPPGSVDDADLGAAVIDVDVGAGVSGSGADGVPAEAADASEASPDAPADTQGAEPPDAKPATSDAPADTQGEEPPDAEPGPLDQTAPDAEDAVLPEATVYIELTWITPVEAPGDSGPSGGADLDLHLLHPNVNSPQCDPDGDGVLAATCGCDVDGDGLDDGLFESPWDCFWFDPSPDWGASGPLNDPLHGDDPTEKTGPETILLQEPEDGATYRIAVHGWSGPSALATVRIFITGSLVFEMSDVPLDEGEAWHVATLSWPSGEVLPIPTPDGEPHIGSAPNGFCFQP